MDRLRYTVLLSLLLTQLSYAHEVLPSKKPFYLTANAGLFTGTSNERYLDQTDSIPGNISETVQQKGYTGGLGIGYSKQICQYLLGAELSGGWMSSAAIFQSGPSTTAFYDKLALLNYLDLVFVPGVFLTPSITGYIKIGASMGTVQDKVNTPVGFVPVYETSHSTQHVAGFTTSLGLKKWLTPTLGIFAEYNYRDYGVTFPSFENFTAAYTHKARIFGQSVLVGLNYQFA